MNELPLLSLLIWIPIFSGFLLLVLGDKNPGMSKLIALVASLLTLAFCLPLYQGFEIGTAAMQFTEQLAWIPSLNINYALGVDGAAHAGSSPNQGQTDRQTAWKGPREGAHCCGQTLSLD